MSSIRLFVAIYVPPLPQLARLIEQLDQLPLRISTVRVDQMHLTLRFLGNMPPDRVGELGHALDRAVASDNVRAFNLHLACLGRFPARGSPRVIFAAPTFGVAPGVTSGSGPDESPAEPSQDITSAEPAHRLAIAVGRQLAAIDPPIEPDPKPFDPHLTLARVKSGRRTKGQMRRPNFAGLHDLLCRHAAGDLGCARIDAVHLVESCLSPAGPDYITRHRATLRD